MKFETMPAAEPQKQETAEKWEWLPRDAKRCADRWLKIGSVFGGFLLVGYGVKLYEERATEYEQYRASVGSLEKEKTAALREKIQELCGEETVKAIENADWNGYFARQEVRSEPVFSGFENAPSPMDRAPLIFTERFGLYPKGWFAGEMNEIRYGGDEPGKERLGRFSAANSTLVLYRQGNADAESSASGYTLVGDHESAHANDWATDTDSELEDRFELLHAVIERMQSSDAYSRAHFGASERHEKMLDGTPHGLEAAAKEYWADIFAGYRADPKVFKEMYPADFDLVDTHIHKTDPGFDVFNANAGPFDPYSGLMRPAAQDFMKEKGIVFK